MAFYTMLFEKLYTILRCKQARRKQFFFQNVQNIEIFDIFHIFKSNS